MEMSFAETAALAVTPTNHHADLFSETIFDEIIVVDARYSLAPVTSFFLQVEETCEPW